MSAIDSKLLMMSVFSQWIWPVPLIVVSIFAPESPWWLVRKGRIEEARHNLMRLTSRNAEGQNDDFDLDETIAMMQHTHLLEQKVSSSRKPLAPPDEATLMLLS